MELPEIHLPTLFVFQGAPGLKKTGTSCVAFKFFPLFFLSLSVGNNPPPQWPMQIQGSATAWWKGSSPEMDGMPQRRGSNWQHGNSQPTIPFFGTWEGGTFPYFLACWYRGYVRAPGVCLFFCGEVETIDGCFSPCFLATELLSFPNVYQHPREISHDDPCRTPWKIQLLS